MLGLNANKYQNTCLPNFVQYKEDSETYHTIHLSAK